MVEELKKHQEWIATLIANNLPKPHSKIQNKHLHLLVRWYPQIDHQGTDGYEKYIKCKNRKASKSSKKFY